MRQLAAAVVVLVMGFAAIAAAAPSPGPSIELRARRGIGGVVPAGGLDVVEIEVRSGAEVETEVALVVDGAARSVAVPARGRAVVVVARRVPPGLTALPAVALRAGDAVATVAAMRVVRRPVLLIADDPGAVIGALDPWRRGDPGLGELIAVTPESLPTRWQALLGIGALVLDRPIEALEPEAARLVARHLGGGGRLCRLDGGAVRCAQPAPVAVPRTHTAASIAAVPRALGWLALAAAAALLALAIARTRWRGAGVLGLCVAAAVLPLLIAPAPSLAVRGVRVTAGDEDWVAAEIGAAELGAAPRLDGDLWIERPGSDALAPLDSVGLDGRLPGPGSYRVRGFVPAGAGGWASRLERVARPAVAAP